MSLLINITDNNSIKQNSTNTSTNTFCKTSVRTRFGPSSQIPFDIVDGISGNQLILTANVGDKAYSSLNDAGDCSIVGIGADGDRALSALTLTPYVVSGTI